MDDRAIKEFSDQFGLSEETLKWLYQPRPDSFFRPSNKKHSKLELQQIWDEIPDDIKPAAVVILYISEKNHSHICLDFRCMFYHVFKRFEEECKSENPSKNSKKIYHALKYFPMYWWRDGIMIEPEMFVRATNGLVKWKGDETCNSCTGNVMGVCSENTGGYCRFYEGHKEIWEREQGRDLEEEEI